MHVVTAACGHSYERERAQGRRRLLCDACLPDPMTYGERAQRAAWRRRQWRQERGEPTRTARCGHPTSYHPGPAKRPCPACVEQRACVYCGADITGTRRRRYCSLRCNEIAAGQRLAAPLSPRRCELPECGAEYQPKMGRQRCCCEHHGKIVSQRERRATGKEPQRWTDKRRDAYHRRRALRKATTVGDPVLLATIAERDGWRCGICHRAVSPTKTYPDPRSPSLDHVIPLSMGGTHEPANTQLTHLWCNVSKGNRGGAEQLALI